MDRIMIQSISIHWHAYLKSDGQVDTMQTLHNINEDELTGFEKAVITIIKFLKVQFHFLRFWVQEETNPHAQRELVCLKKIVGEAGVPIFYIAGSEFEEITKLDHGFLSGAYFIATVQIRIGSSLINKRCTLLFQGSRKKGGKSSYFSYRVLRKQPTMVEI
ncbi:hypothetical protein HanPI659440_Chr10g0371761 [Helianthus annuus]|nr:hypothetical protein HanPI659440_Chr10g0371761 [Helianthus annuus]